MYAGDKANVAPPPARPFAREVNWNWQPSDHQYACLLPGAEKTLTECLSKSNKEIQMLKNLLLVNLDLVQQQSDRLVSKDKELLALKRENASLKSKIHRNNKLASSTRISPNTPSSSLPVHVSTDTVQTKSINTSSPSQDSTELPVHSTTTTLIGDATLDKCKNSYLPSKGDCTELLNVSEMNSLLTVTEDDLTEPKNYLFSADDEILLDVTSIDVETELSKPNDTTFGNDITDHLHTPEITAADRLKETIFQQKLNTMLVKKRESPQDRRRFGSRPPPFRSYITNYMPTPNKSRQKSKSPSQLKLRPSTVKAEAENQQSIFGKSTRMETNSDKGTSSETAKHYDGKFTVNKKSKIIRTYGKDSKRRDSEISAGRRLPYKGLLSDRLKLIDTTPTGEDPYQLSEADMREQSPIPKLMLQKEHSSKSKIFCSDGLKFPSESIKSLLDSSVSCNSDEGSAIRKNQLELGASYTYLGKPKDEDDILDAEATKAVKNAIQVETSVCNYSYEKISSNISSRKTVDSDDNGKIFRSKTFCSSSKISSKGLNYINDKVSTDTASKSKETLKSRSLLKRKSPVERFSIRGTMIARGRVGSMRSKFSSCSSQHSRSEIGDLSFAVPLTDAVAVDSNKRKRRKIVRQPTRKKPIGACPSGRKTSPLPITSRIAYHTAMSDVESSWYMGQTDNELDEDFPLIAEAAQSVIEVPHWRERIYTSRYSMEGTENLDDDIFDKRHHKRELDEKRRKRWDIQRQREQVVLERLRRRQHDAPWYRRPSGNTDCQRPHTLSNVLRENIQYIDIVESLPVSAFGEPVVAIPWTYFYLPWLKSSSKHLDGNGNKEKKELSLG